MALMDFNAAEIPPFLYEAIPAGTYEAWIIDIESRPTRTGKGRGYNVKFEIISGECKGRIFYEWFTVEHDNKKVQEIGKRKLSALCRALGVLHPEDSSDLHGIPFLVTLGIERNDSTRNCVKGVRGVGRGQLAVGSGK